MPRVLLFGAVAESAGTRSTWLPGGSVAHVLDAATSCYGEGFAEQMSACRVWVNGEPAEMETRVGDDDELALLPPVSGGCGDAPPVSGGPWARLPGAPGHGAGRR